MVPDAAPPLEVHSTEGAKGAVQSNGSSPGRGEDIESKEQEHKSPKHRCGGRTGRGGYACLRKNSPRARLNHTRCVRRLTARARDVLCALCARVSMPACANVCVCAFVLCVCRRHREHKDDPNRERKKHKKSSHHRERSSAGGRKDDENGSPSRRRSEEGAARPSKSRRGDKDKAERRAKERAERENEREVRREAKPAGRLLASAFRGI